MKEQRVRERDSNGESIECKVRAFFYGKARMRGWRDEG